MSVRRQGGFQVFELAKSDTAKFKNIFLDMKKQFPQSELKDFEAFKRLLNGNNYSLYIALDNSVDCGYCLLYENKKSKFLWLDYIAVLEKYHCKGYGQRILEFIKNNFSDFDGIYLEVEKPDINDINTFRRIKFYESLGAVKLDCRYFYPNKDGCIAMDLYYMPFTPKGTVPVSEDVMNAIKHVLSSIHSDYAHLDEVLNKIN